MEFRRYQSSDIDAVIAVFRSNIPKYFGPEEEPGLRDFLGEFPEHYYVIEKDDSIVGAGGIGLNDDNTVSLCWGMVRNDHLGTGLGKSLTEYRIKRSREIFGKRSMVTCTSQHTEGFYRKFGFITLEKTPDGFGPGIDVCKLRKDL